MKKQLLLLALTLGTQVSAGTVLEALGPQGTQYLTIINGAKIEPMQEFTRKKLNRRLTQNFNAVTPSELKDLSLSLEDFATVVTPLLSKNKTDALSSEDFAQLVQQIKALLEGLAAPRVQITPAIAGSGALDSTPIEESKIGEEIADETDLEDYILSERKKTLMQDVRELNEMSSNTESSSDIDVNTVFENYKDFFKQFIKNEWPNHEGNLSKQDFENRLIVFFNTLGLAPTDYNSVLPTFIDALVGLQNEMWEEQLALPIHPSLLGLTSLPAIIIEDTDADAADREDTRTEADEATSAAIEAMINRLTKPGKIKHEDFIALGSAFELYEIKEMLAQNLRGLDEESSTDPELFYDEDDNVTLRGNDNDDTETVVDPHTEELELLTKLRELDQEINTQERKVELIKLMQKALQGSKKASEKMTARNAAALMYMVRLFEEIKELLGEDKALIQNALLGYVDDSDKVELTDYIMTLFPSKITPQSFVTDVRRLNRISQNPTVLADHDSLNTFVTTNKRLLKKLIHRFWRDNNRFALPEELSSELMDVFKEIGLTEGDYAHAHPILTKALVTLQKEIGTGKKQGKKAAKKQRRKQEVIEPVTTSGQLAKDPLMDRSMNYFLPRPGILNSDDYYRILFGRNRRPAYVAPGIISRRSLVDDPRGLLTILDTPADDLSEID